MNGTQEIHSPRRGSLDVIRLFEAGGLFRFSTRHNHAPVRAFDRAGWFVFGCIAGVAMVGAWALLVTGKGGL